MVLGNGQNGSCLSFPVVSLAGIVDGMVSIMEVLFGTLLVTSVDIEGLT